MSTNSYNINMKSTNSIEVNRGSSEVLHIKEQKTNLMSSDSFSTSPRNSNANVIAHYVPPFASWPANLKTMQSERFPVRYETWDQSSGHLPKNKFGRSASSGSKHLAHRHKTSGRESVVVESVPVYELKNVVVARDIHTKNIEIPEVQIDEYETNFNGSINTSIEKSKRIRVEKVVENREPSPIIIESTMGDSAVHTTPVQKIVGPIRSINDYHGVRSNGAIEVQMQGGETRRYVPVTESDATKIGYLPGHSPNNAIKYKRESHVDVALPQQIQRFPDLAVTPSSPYESRIY